MRQGQSWHRGCENDDAADGILVVQIRHLRTVSREIPEFATREELMTTSMRACRHGARILPADGCT
jgi:hypothetical protein